MDPISDKHIFDVGKEGEKGTSLNFCAMALQGHGISLVSIFFSIRLALIEN